MSFVGRPSQAVSGRAGKPVLQPRHHEPHMIGKTPMDGRDKKRLEVIKQKLQMLKQQLAGAKKQDDEPGEVQGLEKEIAKLEAEATKLRG